MHSPIIYYRIQVTISPPSAFRVDELQEMLKTCEEFAKSYNLKFSIDVNPVKCKLNLWLLSEKKDPRPNPLPWTDKCKHLGINIENKINGCEHDMKVKAAQ